MQAVMIPLRRAIGVAVWIAALCACLFVADRVTRRDDGARKYGPFFEEKDEQAYDVLFFGTSHMLNAVFPMELWRDYGITSYNMANNSECLDVTEWVLRMAFAYHKPKVAVIDVFYIDRQVDEAWAYGFRHLFLDEIPLSPLKVKAVTSTLPKSEWMEFLVPFSLYHSRWEEMLTGTTERQVDTEPCMMGAELRIGRSWPGSYERTQEMNTEELPGTQALRNIAQICRENGVEPVFVCVPSASPAQLQMNTNGVRLLAEELDVPFVQMMDVEGLVDFSTDMYDGENHLNPDGGSKVTAYMGQWLTEHYPLVDKRSDSRYTAWYARLTEYQAYRELRWGDLTLLDQ